MTERELNEVRELRLLIRELEQRIMLMRDALMNIVPLRNGMPQGYNFDSRIERVVVKVSVLEEKLLELKKQRELARLKISAAISAANLTEKEAAVMHRRYVCCMRFRDIGFELKYSDAHVFYLHRHALRKMIVV